MVIVIFKLINSKVTPVLVNYAEVETERIAMAVINKSILSFSIVQEFSGFCKGENLSRPALNQAVSSCIMEASAQTRKDCFYFYEGIFCYFTDRQAGLKGPACGLVSPEMEHPEGRHLVFVVLRVHSFDNHLFLDGRAIHARL